MRLESLATLLFVQQLCHASIRESIRFIGPFRGDSTGDWQKPLTKAFPCRDVFVRSLLAAWASSLTLQWRHNGRHGVSNHQPHEYLLNRLFRRRSRKYQSSVSLTFVREIYRWPVSYPHTGPVTQKLSPFDDVIMMCKVRPFELSDNHHVAMIFHYVPYRVRQVFNQCLCKWLGHLPMHQAVIPFRR